MPAYSISPHLNNPNDDRGGVRRVERLLPYSPHVRYDPSPVDPALNQNRVALVKPRGAAADSFPVPVPEGETMFDFSVRLREDAHLLALLSHYARPGSEDRTAWRDRLMKMDGVEPAQLTALHGELIAFDAIEQNTGLAVLLPDGTLSACYRVTQNGLREFRRVHGIEAAAEPQEPTEKPPPRLPRKKKDQAASPAVATSE